MLPELWQPAWAQKLCMIGLTSVAKLLATPVQLTEMFAQLFPPPAGLEQATWMKTYARKENMMNVVFCMTPEN